MEKLQENIKSLSNKTSGTIRIGIIRALSMYLLPELLSSFLNKYPDVNINIVTGFSAELMKSLANNYVHLVILREDIEWPYYKKNISSSRISIFSKTPIDFFQLPNLPRINYKTNPSLQTIIEKWWKNNFNTPSNIIMQADNSETCVELVKSGLGYAIIPELSLKESEKLFYYPILNKKKQPIKRKTWIYCANEAEDYIAVQKFLQILD